MQNIYGKTFAVGLKIRENRESFAVYSILPSQIQIHLLIELSVKHVNSPMFFLTKFKTLKQMIQKSFTLPEFGTIQYGSYILTI